MSLPSNHQRGSNHPDVLGYYPDRSDLFFTLACIAIGVVLIGFLTILGRDSSPLPRQSEPAAASGALPDTAITRLPRSDILVGRGSPVTINAEEPRAVVPVPSRWSCSEIAEAMRVQGFPAEALAVGPGVVMAESGGRASATAITDRERSIGPFQVNTLVHRYSDECLRSLLCATAAAYKISRSGTDWRPWTAYKSGAWVGRCA